MYSQIKSSDYLGLFLSVFQSIYELKSSKWKEDSSLENFTEFSEKYDKFFSIPSLTAENVWKILGVWQIEPATKDHQLVFAKMITSDLKTLYT